MKNSYLLYGSLCGLIERRRALIENMAADLTRLGALESDRAAVRALLGNGYSAIDIAILAGEARMAAYQAIVAREMSES